MQKQLEGTQKYINEQLDRVARYRWATHAIIVSNTHALPAEYKCSVIKPSNPFTNVCWVSVLTTFSAPHKFWLHRQFSSAQFQKRRNDGEFFGATAGRFEQ